MGDRGWIGGFFNLKVEERMGSKTLFYRKGHCLVIMALDTMIQTYIEGGKETIIEYIHCINKYWQRKNSREIDLAALDSKLNLTGFEAQSSYFVETSSINLVDFESPNNITKLCF